MNPEQGPNDPRCRILVVGLDKELFLKIDPLLSRARFAVERVARGEAGLLLRSQLEFDLLVVRDPLPDMALADFLEALRRAGSSHAATPILVLTEEERVHEVRRVVPEGPYRVLSINEPARLVEEIASRLPGVAARMPARLPVRLEVRLAVGRALMVCESENISEAGMLVRTERLYPVGTRAGFEFPLPGDQAPVVGEGEVVRHSVPEVERVKGVGLRFLVFRGDSLRRLHDFLGHAPAVA